jgi:prepilin-type N-terminal cleavage/methylation domain-containing protein
VKEEGKKTESGFTLMELLFAMAIFLVICGAIFGLLELAQKNYGNESQMSGSFQEARLAIDQIVRDFNQAGYPSLGMYSVVPPVANYAIGPVAWSPGYVPGSVPTTCAIGTAGGGTCSSPGDFDLILEVQPDNASSVLWIRYQLSGGTLYRSVTPKVAGTDPVTATSAAGIKVPFLTNVLNQASGAQLAEITATYPAMFPGGVPVPMFQFYCDSGAGTVPCPTAAATVNSPYNVRDVDITLIVQTPVRDAQTQRLKIVELFGRGHRSNPTN